MKITTVSLSRTIPTGPYMNDKIGMEATLEPTDTPESVLDKLSQLINDFHKSSNQENQPPPISERPFAYRQETIPTISKDIAPESDRIATMIADIYSCAEIKVLEGYRLLAKTKPEFQAAYDQQMKKLSNGLE